MQISPLQQLKLYTKKKKKNNNKLFFFWTFQMKSTRKKCPIPLSEIFLDVHQRKE